MLYSFTIVNDDACTSVYILHNLIVLSAQVAKLCVCNILYRQCMHEVFYSFSPTSPSRVTTWCGAISCSEGDCDMTPQHTVH